MELIKLDILITNLDIFGHKNIYCKLVKADYIFYYSSHLLFETAWKNCSPDFHLKDHYNVFEFDFVVYFLINKFFFLLKNIKNAHKVMLRDLFPDKCGIK